MFMMTITTKTNEMNEASASGGLLLATALLLCAVCCGLLETICAGKERL